MRALALALVAAAACGGATASAQPPPLISNQFESTLGDLVGRWTVSEEDEYWARFRLMPEGRFVWEQGTDGDDPNVGEDECASEGIATLTKDEDHPLGVLRLYPEEECGDHADQAGLPLEERAVWEWPVKRRSADRVLLEDDSGEQLDLRRR